MWYCPAAEGGNTTYEEDWPKLLVSGGTAETIFRQSYCWEIWKRALDEPPKTMYKNMGARKVLAFDSVVENPKWLILPNHISQMGQAYSEGQNQLWTDGSVEWADGWAISYGGGVWDFEGSEYFTCHYDYIVSSQYTVTGQSWK